MLAILVRSGETLVNNILGVPILMTPQLDR